MSLSAVCNVNGNPIPVAANGVTGVNVASGSTVTISLANPTGVNVWNINCTSTDGYNTNSTVVLLQATKLQTGYSCQFVMPVSIGNIGSSVQFTSMVNNNSKLQTTFGIFVLNADGSRLFFTNENLESNVTVGCVYDLNLMLVRIMNAGF